MQQPTQTQVPQIGQPWPGQGGLFAGIIAGPNGAPDQFLILSTAQPADDLAWQPAIDWAASVEADGHRDFALPDRHAARLLWANLQAHFDPRWYWLSELYSRTYAWVQYFSYGTQYLNFKSFEGRARAVRRFNVQSLIHSTEVAEAVAA